MYSNCECDAVCNKPFVAISILTEFYLLRMNCLLYTLMMEVTGSCEIQYNFTRLYGVTLWNTSFNEFSSLRMSFHVTGKYLTCMGQQSSHPLTNYTEWRKNVVKWQFTLVLLSVSVLSLEWLEEVKKRRPPHTSWLGVLVCQGGPKT